MGHSTKANVIAVDLGDGRVAYVDKSGLVTLPAGIAFLQDFRIILRAADSWLASKALAEAPEKDYKFPGKPYPMQVTI